MLKIGSAIVSQPAVLGLAFLGGTIPAVLWLLFWMREDKGNKENLLLVTVTFIAGMLSVIIVLPLEKYIATMPVSTTTMTVLWAASEEALKLFAFGVIMSGSEYLNKPVKYPIYLMAAALGFAALENTMFLLHPISVDNTTLSLLTGNLRFLGSTLLHAAASGMIGVGIGLAYFKSVNARMWYGFFGLMAAIALHSTFNFFIMQQSGENFIQVFAFLWVITIIIMLLFEKLRRMSAYIEKPAS
jgi:RsiW-degrading membrane proteinase PrsW (M82 family)